MVALAFFLLGSQPGQGGIQVREVQYYFKQASKFYALTTTPIARFHDSLSLILLLLSMGCQELARKAQIISLHDQIALLASYSSKTARNAPRSPSSSRISAITNSACPPTPRGIFSPPGPP